MFNIVEKFVSIDGEGPTSGELSTFIRFQKCNLRCSWCDTTYSWNSENINEVLSAEEIYKFIKKNKVTNVTLTGGEPLIQDNIDELLEILSKDDKLRIHIETNGSVNIGNFKERHKRNNIIYIVDFKLPSSCMMNNMEMENLKLVSKNDVYKFVVGSKEDLNVAYDVIKTNELNTKCLVYLSPVFGKIDMDYIVEFMKEHNMNQVRLQAQLHKIIWDKDKRGV